MSNTRYRGSGEQAEMLNPSSRGHSLFRGRPSTGRRGKWSGRGRGSNPNNPASSTGNQEEVTAPVRLRPTHFLALPLNNHPSLMAQINTFQKALFSKSDGLVDNFASGSTPSRAPSKGSKVTRVKSSLVRGLDSSILIDPRRLHMTLGVMALEQDDCSVETPTERPETTIPTINQGSSSHSSTIQPPASTVLSIEQPTSLPGGQLVPSECPLTQSQPFLPPVPPPTTHLGHSTRKTVSTALSLLNSLKPRISEILGSDKGVKIPLEIMHVFKTEKMWINKKGESRGTGCKKGEVRSGGEPSEVDDNGSRADSGPAQGDGVEENKAIGAGVLYLAPMMKNKGVNADFDKLIQVSDLVHTAFKAAGYLTDRRPLKLHCTILNTSHLKPHYRQPFSYSDVLASHPHPLFYGNAGDSNTQSISMEEGSPFSIPKHEIEGVTVQEENSSSSIQSNLSTSAPPFNSSVNSSNIPLNPQGYSAMKGPLPVSMNLGTFTVEEVQLWIMGSHGPNNEYVSCGGVLLE